MKDKQKTHKETKNEDVNSTENINNQEVTNSENTEETANLTEEEQETVDTETLLAAEVKNWQDKYMRLSAEFDNYRKRTLKEKMELMGSASEGVIQSILPILDDFDRASEAMSKSDDIESLRSGIELINKRFSDIMQKQGVTEIAALGEELNTDFHDAIAKFPVDDEQKKGKVIDVVEKGYMLKDKVVRFAKVVVGE
ncbi:MAG: nucleotide exchange factor GrpE [Rikenellaceae bacterium]